MVTRFDADCAPTSHAPGTTERRSAIISAEESESDAVKGGAGALAHVTSRQEVWITTGSEIVDWYKANYLRGA